jgi:hypothetical protein
MITVSARGWAFSFYTHWFSAGEGLARMIKPLLTIRSAGFVVVFGLVLACALISVAKAQDGSTKTTAQHPGTKKSSSKKSAKKHSHRKKSARVRGQQKIDSERALAIQQALIREHYLSGTATGTWNQASEEAMRRYQADHGWQSKTVPDSRALIKLGLGPSKDHLLNPESAMTTAPDAPKAQAAAPTSHPAAPTSDPPAVPTATPSTPAITNPPAPQRRFVN